MLKILHNNSLIWTTAILVVIVLSVFEFNRQVGHAAPQQSNTSWLDDTIWEYPGGDMKASRIIFRADGNLVFDVEFADLNPAHWQYNNQDSELSFVIPNINQEMLKNRIKRGRGQVKRVDLKKQTLIYDFDNKTEVFDFMGWNYFKKREY